MQRINMDEPVVQTKLIRSRSLGTIDYDDESNHDYNQQNDYEHQEFEHQEFEHRDFGHDFEPQDSDLKEYQELQEINAHHENAQKFLNSDVKSDSGFNSGPSTSSGSDSGQASGSCAMAKFLAASNPLKSSASSPSGPSGSSMTKAHRRTASLKEMFDNQIGHIDEFVNILVGEAQMAEKAVKNFCYEAWNVCHFSSLPNWLQDNDYIHFGYRPPLPSFNACLKSIFRLHTETGNIWTHGIGCMLFLFLAIYMISFNNFKMADKLMLGIYFTGAITCLLFSTLFHTLSCHSPVVQKTMAKFDYCGISIQIIGSMCPAMYYGFYNQLKYFWIYICGGAIMCVISIVFSLLDRFSKPKYRPIRAIVFLSFGLSNIIPGIHLFFILEPKLFWWFSLNIVQGSLYTIGALLYAWRIPERYFPGKCDYWFQSHQIFHILVVAAATVHLVFIYGMIHLRSMG